jgi:hypothetical protein
MPEPTAKYQVESQKEGVLQRKAIADSITPLQSSSAGQDRVSEVSPIVDEVLRSPGQPLDYATRTFMESRLGQDFSMVRVHTNSKVTTAASILRARAYTIGHDIVFGVGEYDVHRKEESKQLLAHELVHVIQQGADDVVSRTITTSPGSDTVIQRATMETIEAGVKAYNQKNRLPFICTILGVPQPESTTAVSSHCGMETLGLLEWEATKILDRLKIVPTSLIGKAITVGSDKISALCKTLSEQADRESKPVTDENPLKSALKLASNEAIHLSRIFQSGEATYYDLMKIDALNEIMSMNSCIQKRTLLLQWSNAIKNNDAVFAYEAKNITKVEWAEAYDNPTINETKQRSEIRETTKGGLWKEGKRPQRLPEGAGTPATPEIKFEVFINKIFTGLGKDIANTKNIDELAEKERKARNYVANLNQAFRIMKIDNVEAQAVYLAYAFIESDQFRQFTETQGSLSVLKGQQKWVDDPEKIQFDLKNLKSNYPEGGTVNPHGNFKFIGREPVQVTHKKGYIEVVQILEDVVEEYEKEAASGNIQACEFGVLALEAAKALKAEPRQAANPKYTFPISAALMKSRRADISAASTKPTPGVAWTGEDAPSAWVAGGPQKAGSPQAVALLDKSNAFARIFKVLCEGNSTKGHP